MRQTCARVELEQGDIKEAFESWCTSHIFMSISSRAGLKGYLKKQKKLTAATTTKKQIAYKQISVFNPLFAVCGPNPEKDISILSGDIIGCFRNQKVEGKAREQWMNFASYDRQRHEDILFESLLICVPAGHRYYHFRF